MKLENKVAIVTGATSGMGRAIAERFAREGAAVVVGGRHAERGQAVVEGIRREGGRAELALGDVSTLEANQLLVDTALRAFGAVDVVVPNAGILALGSVTEVPLETWHAAIGANLHSVFYLCRLAIPHMKKNGGAIVVNGSIAAYKSFPNHPAYCATKAAVLALARQMAREYAPEIRVNTLCPGPVDTPLIWDSARAFENPERAVQDAADATLIGRLGRPEEVAQAALFLASQDSAWITGAALTVDGGILCR